MARVRLYADDCDWPLWGPRGGPLLEDDLPLSDGLKNRIRAWFNAYATSRRDWPLWTAPPDCEDPEAEERAWVAEGAALRDAIANELGAEFIVVFDV